MVTNLLRRELSWGDVGRWATFVGCAGLTGAVATLLYRRIETRDPYDVVRSMAPPWDSSRLAFP